MGPKTIFWTQKKGIGVLSFSTGFALVWWEILFEIFSNDCDSVRRNSFNCCPCCSKIVHQARMYWSWQASKCHLTILGDGGSVFILRKFYHCTKHKKRWNLTLSQKKLWLHWMSKCGHVLILQLNVYLILSFCVHVLSVLTMYVLCLQLAFDCFWRW